MSEWGFDKRGLQGVLACFFWYERQGLGIPARSKKRMPSKYSKQQKKRIIQAPIRREAIVVISKGIIETRIN